MRYSRADAIAEAIAWAIIEFDEDGSIRASFTDACNRWLKQMESITNQSRHRERQWGKWRRRQARKQNRRRN